MPQEVIKALQNGHDHPLIMAWKGKKDAKHEDWVKTRTCIISRLSKGMASAASCERMQSGTINEFMSAISALHQKKREEEYLVTAVTEDGGLVAAINHRFHDASSMGLLLDGYADHPKLVAEGILKLPSPCSPPSFVKSKRECLRISHEELKSAKALTGLQTRNEVALLLSALIVGTCMQSASIMVLHTLKPRREREKAGGDFSCLTDPLQVSSTWSIREAAAAVREHLGKLRAGSKLLVETEAGMGTSQQEEGKGKAPVLVFDTWIGSGIASPAGLEVRVHDGLLDSFAFVLSEYIIAYEEGEDLFLHFYGEFATFSHEVVDRILK
eukprot:767521-Hanusia_phi.AAC.2